MNKIFKNSLVREILTLDYRLSDVFDQYQVDIKQNGETTLENVCEQFFIDVNEFVSKLTYITNDGAPINEYNTWTTERLIKYIVNVLHAKAVKNLGRLKILLKKVIENDADKNSDLLIIDALFEESYVEMITHMGKEETIVFPRIKEYSMASQNPQFKEKLRGTIHQSIEQLIKEHDVESDRFKRFSNWTKDFAPMQGASNEYREMLDILKEYEKDLTLHIHLENNVLFPRAIQMEKDLFDS